jgi:hypothetical protein
LANHTEEERKEKSHNVLQSLQETHGQMPAFFFLKWLFSIEASKTL